MKQLYFRIIPTFIRPETERPNSLLAIYGRHNWKSTLHAPDLNIPWNTFFTLSQHGHSVPPSFQDKGKNLLHGKAFRPGNPS